MLRTLWDPRNCATFTPSTTKPMDRIGPISHFDGRSDYDAFIKNGIPGGGIATGAEGVKTEKEGAMFGGNAGEWYDHCYHQLCDNLDNLAYDAWVMNTKVDLLLFLFWYTSLTSSAARRSLGRYLCCVFQRIPQARGGKHECDCRAFDVPWT